MQVEDESSAVAIAMTANGPFCQSLVWDSPHLSGCRHCLSCLLILHFAFVHLAAGVDVEFNAPGARVFSAIASWLQ